jgi:hypothetical protein
MSLIPCGSPRRAVPSVFPILPAALAMLGIACGSEQPTPPPASAPAAASAPAPVPAAAARVSSAVPAAPADLDLALALGLASFEGATPLPARMEFLVREGGELKLFVASDEASDVFHKVMHYEQGGESRILTIAGAPLGKPALVKLWQEGADGFGSVTLWEQDFGGKRNRMRDVEVADLYGDGGQVLAVATHDQGVVAVLRPDGKGGFEVDELDREPNTFVHEIEIGDVDGDGTLEVYATPSEPNKLDGSDQSGQVVRYVPKDAKGRVVVADLGDRHAKEILVADVDGDGTDELYVVVEGKLVKGSKTQLAHGVEVRRYEAGTDPQGGAVIAKIDDRLCRFITVGDVEGDGQLEMVIASFSRGVWLARPGPDPNQPWDVSLVDRDSGGFEHAALLTDLDADGKDELYVASDKHKELRRYVWTGDRLARETIYTRTDGKSIFTWNIMPVPRTLVPR